MPPESQPSWSGSPPSASTPRSTAPGLPPGSATTCAAFPPEYRRLGVGTALFRVTAAFARASGYRKFVIQVRASNTAAQAFYSRLGFRACGRLARQVAIDGREDDEVLMELFLE